MNRNYETMFRYRIHTYIYNSYYFIRINTFLKYSKQDIFSYTSYLKYGAILILPLSARYAAGYV